MEQKFNILLDALPGDVVVNGREYEADTDFRNVLAYLRLLESDKDEDTKVFFAVRLFFGGDIEPEDARGLLEWVQWFVNHGEKREETPEAPKGERVFDFTEDSNRIYAAFFQVYGVNIRTAKMHWWTFWHLFEALPSGTHLAEVMEIRGRKFSKGMSAEQRNALQRAKDKYRIGEKRDLMSDLFESIKGIC